MLIFFELDYLSPSSMFNTFTHTWSLGAEEQFYVVFPMFTWLFYFRAQGFSFEPGDIVLVSRLYISRSLPNAVFDSLCPANQEYCYPDNGSSFLYRDKDHFNSPGSMLLAEPFVDLLRSSGTITPGE